MCVRSVSVCVRECEYESRFERDERNGEGDCRPGCCPMSNGFFLFSFRIFAGRVGCVHEKSRVEIYL